MYFCFGVFYVLIVFYALLGHTINKPLTEERICLKLWCQIR